MQFQPIKVVFDSGREVVVELKSRDIAKCERLGIDIESTGKVIGSYALAFVALQRMHRTGELDFDLPENAEGLEDIADLDQVEDPDEGEGSGQDPAIG